MIFSHIGITITVAYSGVWWAC